MSEQNSSSKESWIQCINLGFEGKNSLLLKIKYLGYLIFGSFYLKITPLIL